MRKTTSLQHTALEQLSSVLNILPLSPSVFTFACSMEIKHLNFASSFSATAYQSATPFPWRRPNLMSTRNQVIWTRKRHENLWHQICESKNASEETWDSRMRLARRLRQNSSVALNIWVQSLIKAWRSLKLTHWRLCQQEHDSSRSLGGSEKHQNFGYSCFIDPGPDWPSVNWTRGQMQQQDRGMYALVLPAPTGH